MTEKIAIAVTLAAFIFLILRLVRQKRSRKKYEAEVNAWKLRLEMDLSQAKEERNRLLDALGDAFIIVDSKENIRFANSAAQELFRGRALIGRPVREAFLDPRLADALLKCLDTGKPVQSRVVLSQQTSPLGAMENRGQNAWIIDAAPHSDTPDGNRNTRVVIRDVTAEHQLDQIRRDFVANASHELRTPLAIINGYIENLLEDGMVEEPDMARRFLSIMQRHTERISRIVEDMLVISRLESGEASAINIEPFKLRSCVNDVLERLESVIRNQEAIVSVDFLNDQAMIQGDRFYWTQVLFNLVENALKQNPHAGLKVNIGCEDTPDLIRLWVSDNGIGIPSVDLPHIFRRFYRVEKHHSQLEIKGTGLGLSIVKRAIEAHGGTITVTSVPGRETKFLMTIPRERE
ncbi:MAG: ATP-binding protein [Akkermansiaceae bacterium]|jgi:two-component system, OmpR family, phosphate regulon sensor histidine kinase PhoR|nr:ATP-binding protein [Akkermansiaceae bacterium]MDP4645841.1 ATP-binding protein [Akkermansiaceae bacterium]MDP4720445.1 ATP-binding protein [Akkermansiaceae bacterium]MDP4779161.1 ATP-binding protein [Akkermansiaceae bacterium]MDP4848226.1 ATP-binding protein [Akkermansiaceae bacterium]